MLKSPEVAEVKSILLKVLAKVDKVEAKVDKVKSKVDYVEAKVDKVEAKVDKVDYDQKSLFMTVLAKVDNVEAKVDKVDQDQQVLSEFVGVMPPSTPCTPRSRAYPTIEKASNDDRGRGMRGGKGCPFP